MTDNSISASAPTPTPMPASYDIAPEDQHIADRIVGMDPVNDVPGASNTTGILRNIKGLRAVNLPPEARKRVESQLDGIPFDQRADRESGLVAAAMRPLLIMGRASGAMGENATPYHREMATIEHEWRQAKRIADDCADQLAEVEGYRTEFDETTGEAKPIPVFAAFGERRDGLIRELAAQQHKMRLLTDPEGNFGPEGKNRMKVALYEAVEAEKAVAAQRADRIEIERRAQHMEREQRLNQQAEQLASFRRNVVR